MNVDRTRWWWYLALPLGVLLGAVLAVWLRTRGDTPLTLERGAVVSTSLGGYLDAPADDARDPGDRYEIVAFGYTHCPDVCPTTLLAIHDALLALGPEAARILPIFITVDPARDDAATLRAYVENFDRRIRTVSDPQHVQAAMHAFRIRAARHAFGSAGDYSMEHTAIAYVLDASHRVIAALPEWVSTSELTHELVETLRRDAALHRDTSLHRDASAADPSGRE